jgi:hypothetical protein
MNVEKRGMRVGLAAASVLLAILSIMAGCGGSGSSGFDVSPLTESQAITLAVARGECVGFAQQTYCASGAEARSGRFQGALVIIQEPSSPLVCDGDTSAPQCTASLEFATVGFQTPNSLRAAISATADGPWTLVPLAVPEDVTNPRTVTITVPGNPNATSPVSLIAAVLVYVGPVPDMVPPTAAHLADFGADLAYVSSHLQLVAADVD